MFKATPLPVLLLLTALALTAAAHDSADHGPNHAPDTPAVVKRDSPGKGKAPHAAVTDYKDDQVLGWNLRVHQDLIADEALYKEVRDEIHHQLFRITKVLPKEKVDLLRQVPIWVELNNPYSRSCQYHPSKDWLVENGYLGEKANCVELSNAKRFVRSSQSYQPCVLLHELAHAYHDLHLGITRASGTHTKPPARPARTTRSCTSSAGTSAPTP